MDAKDEFEFTLKEISNELGISKEKCRQVLLMAIKKLKTPKYKEKLKNIKDSIKEMNE